MDLFKRIQNLSAIYDDDGPSAMVLESRPMFNDGGMLVKPNADGSRPGYSGKKHNLSTTTDRPKKYTKELLKQFRKDMPSGLSIEEGRPGQFNYKIIIKGGNKDQPTIRMSGVVNENNKKLFTDFVINKTKEYYPNRLTKEEFKNLRLENKSMKTEDFAKFLDQQGYETFYGKKWNMKNVSDVQTKLNLGKGQTGPLVIRTVSEAKKIILETPGGRIFLKSNPTDSEITRRASDLISQEKIKGKTGKYWPPGGTKETKMFHNFYQSSLKEDGRMKLLTKTPLDENGNINWKKIEKNGLPAWKNAKFFDNKSGATFKWGKNYEPGNLKKQVDAAYGDGFFAKSVKVYDEQAKLNKTTFGGRSLNEIIREGILKKELVVKLGREPTPKELKEFYKLRKPNFSFTESHHIEGVGKNPFRMELASRAANRLQNNLQNIYDAAVRTGDPEKIKLAKENYTKGMQELPGNIRFKIDGRFKGETGTIKSIVESSFDQAGTFDIKTPEGRLNMKKLNTSVAFQKFLKENGIVISGCGRIANKEGGRITFSNGTCGGFKNADEFAKGDPEGFLKTVNADPKASQLIESAAGSAKGQASLKGAFSWASKSLNSPTGFLGGELLVSSLFQANATMEGKSFLESLDQGLLWFLPNNVLNSYKKSLTEGMSEQDSAYIIKALNLENADKDYENNMKQLEAIEARPELKNNLDYKRVKEKLKINADKALNYGTKLFGEFGDYERDSDIPYIEGVTSNAPTDLNRADGYTKAMNELFKAKKQKAVKDTNKAKQFDLGTEYQKYLNDLIMPDIIEEKLGKGDKNYQDYDILGDKSGMFTHLFPSLTRPFAPVTTAIGQGAQSYASTDLPFADKLQNYLENVAISRNKKYLTEPTTMENLTQGDFDIANQYGEGLKRKYASGGIASLTDTIPPESGPTPHGLPYVYNNVKKV